MIVWCNLATSSKFVFISSKMFGSLSNSDGVMVRFSFKYGITSMASNISSEDIFLGA